MTGSPGPGVLRRLVGSLSPMSRGIGATQRAILKTLQPDRWATIAELAESRGRGHRQILSAVRALEARELVRVQRKQIGWKGWGESGPLIRRGASGWPDDADVPTAEVGNRWVWQSPGGWDRRKVELIRAGMPVYGLGVSLPRESSAAERDANAARKLALGD